MTCVASDAVVAVAELPEQEAAVVAVAAFPAKFVFQVGTPVPLLVKIWFEVPLGINAVVLAAVW